MNKVEILDVLEETKMTDIQTLSPLPSQTAGLDGHLDPVLASAPHRIGKVTLIVRDLEEVSQFYRSVLGLRLISNKEGVVRLGTDGSVLLELRQDPEAVLASRQEAGLFHTAFLLPNRADLGTWLAFAAQEEIRLLGASDHLVSEALYLADPEGNGAEIYVDRPSAEWPRRNGMIEMASDPLDLRELVGTASDRKWNGFPAEGSIGHVHLQVGDVEAAEAFYGGVLGLDVTCRYPGANFYGSGGYHHQLATNVWNSRGAPVCSGRKTGLADVEILTDSTALEALREKLPASSIEDVSRNGVSLRDPWGTSISLRPRSSRA